MSEILRFENISLNTEKKNLFNFSLVIKQGDFFLVNGKNAVGKSLLLKLLFLKILPSNGNIYLYEKKIDKNDKIKILEYRKKMGVILQNDYLIPFFSVYQNIEIASEIQSKKENFTKRIDEIIDWLDLKQIKNELVNKLSNGEKQRVVIARALINNPKIIIADQPENYLDESTKKKLFFLFESLNKLGATIIMTSNSRDFLSVKYKAINLGNNK
tara:strand:+ start:43 stop:684 length:642 start_codon:yes stop_codon:yes gene_type:complete